MKTSLKQNTCMKYLSLSLFFAITLSILLLTRCKNSCHKHELKRLNALASANPKEALDSIKAIDADSWDYASRMHLELLRADTRNRCFLPLTSDSMMLAVTDYFDHHGKRNDRIKSHYLLGCTYRDLGRMPEALGEYHSAISLADTTKSSCNFRLIATIHAQISEIFMGIYPSKISLDETITAIRMLDKTGDSTAVADQMEILSKIYVRMHQYRLAETYAYKAYHKFKRVNQTEAALSASSLAGVLVLSGRFSDAYRYIQEFERVIVNSGGASLRTWETTDFYCIKASCLVGLGKVGEGYNLIQHIEPVDDLTKFKLLQCKVQLFKKMNLCDSVNKYLEETHLFQENYNIEGQDKYLQQLQSFYDYSTHERLAEKKKLENYRLKFFLAFLLMAFIAVSYGAYSFVKRKRRKEAEFVRSYATTMILYNNAVQERDNLRDRLSDSESSISRMVEEIQQLKQQKDNNPDIIAGKQKMQAEMERLNVELRNNLEAKEEEIEIMREEGGTAEPAQCSRYLTVGDCWNSQQTAPSGLERKPGNRRRSATHVGNRNEADAQVHV